MAASLSIRRESVGPVVNPSPGGIGLRMLVRLVQDSDLSAITEINDWYILRTTANFSVDPVGVEAMRDEWLADQERFPWLVAIDEPEGEPRTDAGAPREQSVVGFAKASSWKGRCAYDWSAEVTVYVHHEHHRRGIGLMLYERLFAILRDQGYRSLLAGITQPNEPSVRLHERMGMTRAGYYSRVGWKFGAWHDVAYWQMALGDGDSPPTALRLVAEVVIE